MKNIFILVCACFMYSHLAFSQSTPINERAQELLFNAIRDYVYEEVNGLPRAPALAKDFTYQQLNEEKVFVTGTSFSHADQKYITYLCEFDLLGRGRIESEYDFELVFCRLSF